MQVNSVRCIPASGDKSDNVPLPDFPLQFRAFNPVQARSGERSVTPLELNARTFTNPLTIAGGTSGFRPVRIPSNPGFNSFSFWRTASICCSALIACTSFIHCGNAGLCMKSERDASGNAALGVLETANSDTHRKPWLKLGFD